jgi:NADPH-dependent ferric siderophore reductase
MYGTVEAVERLAPRMVRVIFGGSGLDGFESSGFADESALPAIGAALERLVDGAHAQVIVIVDEIGHEVDLGGRGEVSVRWLYRNGVTDDVDVLARAVGDLTFRPGRVHAFVHGEAAEVRAVRRHLLVDRGLDIADHSISPYWRRDHTDEQWREIKAAWLDDQANDGTSSETTWWAS